MALLAGGIALVTDAIVQTDSWGWASIKFAVALLLAAVVLGSFIYRCNTVGNPVIHLGLFKANNFRWADMTMIVFAIGFNAMFLGNVLFLTRVWRHSILKAGLAISVGPLIVIAFATGLTAADALDGFHHIWWLLATCGLTVSLLSNRLVRITAPVAPEMAALDAH